MAKKAELTRVVDLNVATAMFGEVEEMSFDEAVGSHVVVSTLNASTEKRQKEIRNRLLLEVQEEGVESLEASDGTEVKVATRGNKPPSFSPALAAPVLKRTLGMTDLTCSVSIKLRENVKLASLTETERDVLSKIVDFDFTPNQNMIAALCTLGALSKEDFDACFAPPEPGTVYLTVTKSAAMKAAVENVVKGLLNGRREESESPATGDSSARAEEEA